VPDRAIKTLNRQFHKAVVGLDREDTEGHAALVLVQTEGALTQEVLVARKYDKGPQSGKNSADQATVLLSPCAPWHRRHVLWYTFVEGRGLVRVRDMARLFSVDDGGGTVECKG